MKSNNVKKAREDREQAFALLFEKSFSDSTFDEIIDGAAEARDIIISDRARKYAEDIFADIENIDSNIEKHLHARSKARLSHVVLALLRVSVYEIINGVVEAPVSINEAVELAKKYSSLDEAGFVNGVLGSFVREREQQG